MNVMRLCLLTLFAALAFAQDPAAITPYQVFTRNASSGLTTPCSGCSIYTYLAGTTTPRPVYTDSTLMTQNTNPVTTNSDGYVVNGNSPSTITGIWVGTTCYKFVLKDANNVTKWTQDQICDAAQVLKALLAATSNTQGGNGAAHIGYQYPGSSAPQTVQSRLQQYVSMIDFGADPTGSNSAVAAFNAAISSVVGSGLAGKVSIPKGTYKIDSSVTTPTAQGLVVSGSGWGTVLSWTGNNAASSILLIPNCFACTFENFYMNVTNAAGAAVQTENAGLTYTATQDIFRGIAIQGNANVGTCFLIDGPVDANNDQQRYIDDHCFGATSAAWQLGSASSGFNIFNVKMDHSSWTLAGFGAYGVWLRHGNFHWTDGDGGGAYLADFKIDILPSAPISIENSEFENSKQFITTLASGGIADPISIHDVAWDGGCLGQTQAQIKTNCPGGPIAGDMISISYNGPFYFWNNRIGASSSTVLATIGLNLPTSSFSSVYEFRNNIFGTTGIGPASGTVNTSGTAITWVSGTTFSAGGQWAGKTITIAGSPYTISSCASQTACTLGSSAGTQTGVAFSMTQTVFSSALPSLASGNLTYCNSCSAPTRYTDYYGLDSTFAGNVNFTGTVYAAPATQTYTPALAFGGGSTGITYGTQSGAYWVDGSGFTTVRVTIVLTSKGSSTGTATISMPSTSTQGGFGECLVSANGTSIVPMVPFVLAGDSKITLYTQGSTASGSLVDTNFNNNTSLFCYARYN